MGRDRLWRVGLYIRLSREDGRQESLSVQNQRKILLDFLKKDFAGRWELAGEYIDDGLTGTDDSREGFQTLVAHVREGRVNCVLCKTLSRAFRNYADQGYFLEEFFPRYRTRFIALGSPRVDSFLDPEAVQTGLEIPINGILNDRYAARTSADVRRTLDMKRRRGEFIGSFAPYGYAKDPEDKNRLVPDPEAAKVVEEIFLWYTQGLGKGAIAARLNDRGTPNPTAYKVRQGLSVFRQKNDGLWSAMTVDRILSNPVYGGTMVQGRQRVVSYKVHQTMSVPPEDWYVVEGTHQAIVSPDLLDRARAIRESRTRRTPGRGEVHLLAGFLRCADCGASMTRKTARGIAYYTCSTYRRKSKLACTSHTVREDRVTAVLADCLGCSPADLTRPLLFQRLEKVEIREGGEVIPCPVPEDDSVII